jgi:hypothetical protein
MPKSKASVAAAALVATSLASSTAATVPCGSGGRYSCPDQNTCCPKPDESFGCVPSEAGVSDAVCVTGGLLACPVNYTYAEGTNQCISAAGPLPDPEAGPDWPIPMGMAGWQLPYNTCPAFDGPPPLFYLDLGAATGGLKFPCVLAGARGPVCVHACMRVCMCVCDARFSASREYLTSSVSTASASRAHGGGQVLLQRGCCGVGRQRRRRGAPSRPWAKLLLITP